MIEYYITLISYFFLSILAFKSFILKDTYRASISSLSAFLGFSLYFFDSILSIYQLKYGLDIRINYIAINLDILGTLCLFFTTTKIKGILIGNENLLRIKLLNLLFFIYSFFLLFLFNYNYIYSLNQYVLAPMLFYSHKLNIIYFSIILINLILIIIHLPCIKEYTILKLGVMGFSIKYIFKILNEIFPSDFYYISEIILSIIFSILLVIIAKKIYDNSFKLSKDK